MAAPITSPVTVRVRRTPRRLLALAATLAILTNLVAIAPSPAVPTARADSPTTHWVSLSVAPVGAPGSSCAAPGYATLQEAALAVTAGDTIHLCAGRYDLSSGSATPGGVLLGSESMEDPRPFRIEGDGTADTILDGGGTNVVLGSYGALDLEGLTVTRGHVFAVAAAGPISARRVVFVGNEGFFGAALESNTSVAVTDGTFLGNRSRYWGGAIFAPSVSVDRSRFVGNRADAGRGGVVFGGAVFSFGDATIRDSFFEGNSADYGGAVFANRDLTVGSSTFTGNSAGFLGGAAGAIGRTLIVNSTFVDNTAATSPAAVAGGGGGAVLGVDIEISNGTFANNRTASADAIGGASGQVLVFSSGGEIPPIKVAGSLFVGGGCSTVVETPEGFMETSAATTDLGGNVTTDPSCPGRVDSTDGIGLAPLADNGGPTPTMALGAASSAVDVTTGPCPTAVDQRGIARPAGLGCDAGAFEANAPVRVLFNGPSAIRSNATVVNAPVSAATQPPTPGCRVHFVVDGIAYPRPSASDGTVGPFTFDATTDSAGIATGTPGDLPTGAYTVVVAMSDGSCLTTGGGDVGTMVIGSGTVQVGSSGAGTYRLGSTGGWRRNSFAETISVTSAYDNRTKLTTTTTTGAFTWTSATDTSSGGIGWRLRASIRDVTTGAGSGWLRTPCPSELTSATRACGTYTGMGRLQQRDPSGAWVAAPFGDGGLVRFTATLYDGGTLTSCRRKVCRTEDLDDSIGIRIDGVPLPTAPSDALPQVSTPRIIRNGTIRIL